MKRRNSSKYANYRYMWIQCWRVLLCTFIRGGGRIL